LRWAFALLCGRRSVEREIFLAEFSQAGSLLQVCPVMVSEETSIPEKHTAMNPP
jgi:hypothetical protein